MKRVLVAVIGATVMALSVAAEGPQGSFGQAASPPAAPSSASIDAQTAVVKQYCVTCHNDRAKAGDLSLAAFDVAHAGQHPATAEKMVRKLRAGMMPPPGSRRPDAATVAALVGGLEARLDAAAAAASNPGRRPFQRLNRAEYARVIRDLLAIDVDVNAFLPPDGVSSHGFDNISDEQAFSPSLVEGYLRAASAISRLAVGDAAATPSSTTYTVPDTVSQMRHVDGAPIGTRGGVSVVHVFPADGEYRFEMLLYGGPIGDLYGRAARGEQIEVSIDGERMALLDINPNMHESDIPDGLSLQTPPIQVRAGPHRVSAVFIEQADGPVNDLLAPIEFTLGDTNIGEDPGITAPPHLRHLAISGPHKVTGVSDTPSRRRIFNCYPRVTNEQAACAEQILTRLAREAYRGTGNADDFADLMQFYRQGLTTGDFESGIRLAIQAMLANPRFVFRLEPAPETLDAGETYRISDVALASRLSFFLWATSPDAALRDLASQGHLSRPDVLEQQVRRMLADRRSAALSTRFAAQWLRLRDLEAIRPDQLQYPQWDKTLVDASRRESEMLFDSLVREDRSVLDLITADYTFVNERLAAHYRIPNVMGNDFRRVALPDEHRRGILGHASILMLTSIADRTSPVMRGKWVMEVLLGTPPPAPPPDVPEFAATSSVTAGKLLSVRERMEEHRANPSCNSCHRVIDPLGLALEHFDAIGAWRVKDGDVPVDATGILYDGTPLDGAASLRRALVKHADVFILSFTESLMTYALGRPVEPQDMPAIRAIVREAARHDNQMSSFILGVVKSAAFQMSHADDGQTSAGRAPTARPLHPAVPRR